MPRMSIAMSTQKEFRQRLGAQFEINAFGTIENDIKKPLPAGMPRRSAPP